MEEHGFSPGTAVYIYVNSRDYQQVPRREAVFFNNDAGSRGSRKHFRTTQQVPPLSIT
ncbi:MAG TPA: hypothetical protein VK738_05525 [Terriglobales bacterium]|nr:hypothetical protein [Terriglobales bacterium]